MIVITPTIMTPVNVVTRVRKRLRDGGKSAASVSLSGMFDMSTCTRIITVRIGPDPARRLDKALARDVPEAAQLSRSRMARLIADGAVAVNGAVKTKATAPVTEGDEIVITVAEPTETDMGPEAITIDIRYEDDDVVVINKPAGMVVHPAPGSPQGTLVNALLHHFDGRLSGVGGQKRPGIVHRIDKDTSGLLVVAKSDAAHHGLAAQFANHSVTREYLALCHNTPDRADPRLSNLSGVGFRTEGTFTITTQIGRHKTDRQRQAVLPKGGRHAVTHVHVVEPFGAAALVSCRLETGRTHQIRVHMAHVGHALIGDQIYGRRRMTARHGATLAAHVNAFPRQALHAATLGFVHPVRGGDMHFTADLSADMDTLLQMLRHIPPTE